MSKRGTQWSESDEKEKIGEVMTEKKVRDMEIEETKDGLGYY